MINCRAERQTSITAKTFKDNCLLYNSHLGIFCGYVSLPCSPPINPNIYPDAALKELIAIY